MSKKSFVWADALGTLQRLKKSDRGLFDRIKAFVDKWVSKLKKYYQSDHTISIEGQTTSQLETLQQIQELFMEALVDASENLRNTDIDPNKKNR